MEDLREWKVDRLKNEANELDQQMLGLDRLLNKCEDIKKVTINNKIALQQQIFEVKRILRGDYGIVDI